MDNVYVRLLSNMLESGVLDMGMFGKVLSFCRGNMPLIPFKIPKYSKIIRSSLNNEGLFHDNISRLSYPPVEYARTDRASLKGIPMFYGSIFTSAAETSNAYPRIMTAFETTDILRGFNSKGRVFATQSLWVPKRDLCVFAFPFSKIYKKPCREILQAQKKWMELVGGSASQQGIELAEYMGELMAMKNVSCLYDITARVIHDVLYVNPLANNMDGVIYPSVWGDGQGMNICLKKETVDECVKFEDAMVVMIDKQVGNSVIINIARSVIADDGTLKWTPTSESLELLKRHMDQTNC